MATLSYRDSGKGFPVVFIHGFGESSNIWKQFEEQLSASFRIVSVDLPGFGESPLHTSELSMESMANDLHQTLSQIGLAAPLLIGHSLGGYVTLAYAEMYPGQLSGFGLFHSSAFADTPEKKEHRNRIIETIRSYGSEGFLQLMIPDLFYKENRPRLQAVIDQMLAEAYQIAPQSLIQATAAMRDRKDRRHVLQQTQLPVLFIVGAQDQAVPIEFSKEQMVMPHDCTAHILHGVAHMGMFEAPERCLSAVKQFATYCASR